MEGAASDPKYLITYVEGNVGDRTPIGRNIATEPSRRRAAELARDTGMPHINRRIPGSRDTQRRAGLLLYVPLYANGARLETVADRQAALLGWVYAQVFPDVFLDGVLGPMGKVLRLHFFETGQMSREMLLYASEGVEGDILPQFERVTGMVLVGLDGRFLRVNQSLCEIVGYSEAKLLQKRFQDITHVDDLTADLTLLRELIDGRRRYYQLEKRYIHHDGHTVWIGLTASLVRDEAGVPLHCIAQIEDITGRKRLEDNLADARDEALESARIKSEFLATMTDEIRMPIDDVVNAARMLRDTPLTGVQAEKIRTIETAGDALLTVSNDILDYSKIEAGQIVLEIAHVDLRQCVNDTLALFAERARRKGIKLETSVAERVPSHAAADAKRLQQILVNLLNNAIKLTQGGEVRVSLTAEALDATTGRQRLKFAVRDTGAGMPAEKIEQLFKSFSPVDASTRKLGGTGLGVATSSRLAELMGGTMWAQSELGRGSTFHFTVLVEPRAAMGG